VDHFGTEKVRIIARRLLSKEVVYREHFGSLVFFSEGAAKLGLEKLIEEYHNERT
jgi:hypothetical protein